MARGYWIARLNINDQTGYDEYRSRNGAPIAAHGGRFLVRGGQAEKAFGEMRDHNVVVEFPTYDAAVACFHSPEYQAASQYLKKSCDVDLVIIAGYEGSQP